MPRARQLFTGLRGNSGTDEDDVEIDYRKQSAELRARAAKADNPALKDELLAMAKRFERLAEVKGRRA